MLALQSAMAHPLVRLVPTLDRLFFLLCHMLLEILTMCGVWFLLQIVVVFILFAKYG